MPARRNSLAFAPPSTRRVRTIRDRSTGRILTTSNQAPQVGDQVLVEHQGVLRIGIQQEGAVRLRSGEEVQAEGIVIK